MLDVLRAQGSGRCALRPGVGLRPGRGGRRGQPDTGRRSHRRSVRRQRRRRARSNGIVSGTSWRRAYTAVTSASERDSADAAQRRQRRRLGEELQADVPARCADRSPHADLGPAFEHRDHHHVGDADPADQQRDATECQQQRTQPAVDGGAGLQRIGRTRDLDLVRRRRVGRWPPARRARTRPTSAPSARRCSTPCRRGRADRARRRSRPAPRCRATTAAGRGRGCRSPPTTGHRSTPSASRAATRCPAVGQPSNRARRRAATRSTNRGIAPRRWSPRRSSAARSWPHRRRYHRSPRRGSDRCAARSHCNPATALTSSTGPIRRIIDGASSGNVAASPNTLCPARTSSRLVPNSIELGQQVGAARRRDADHRDQARRCRWRCPAPSAPCAPLVRRVSPTPTRTTSIGRKPRRSRRGPPLDIS